MTDLSIGVFDDPCRQIAPMPEPVAAYLAEAARISQTGARPEPPSDELFAQYRAWQAALRTADFAHLCRYAAENAALPPATPGRILFFGDSITEAWLRMRPDFFTGDRVDRGISGQTTLQMIARFRTDVIDLKPALVHILAGINDIGGNTGPTSLANIRGHLQSMAELARAHGIRVVFGSILPANRFTWMPDIDPVPSVRALNDWLRGYCADQGFGFVDYFAALDDGTCGLSSEHAYDGVHPTAAGYAVMEPLAEAAIAAALAR
jgi:acyl-CoA thioesterase I